MVDHPVPRAMRAADIAATVEDFAAAHAMDAGFDGVEMHGPTASCSTSPRRQHQPPRRRRLRVGRNRIRFVVEVIDAVAAEHTALRVSPANPFNGIVEHDAPAVYGSLMAALATHPPAYVHVVETVLGRSPR